jgi:hypothetical protein
MNHNPNCDGGNCSRAEGEVRVLPHTKSPNHGNSILCKSCYYHEIAHRRDRNMGLETFAKYDLPDWESLTVYPEMQDGKV